MCVVSLGQGTVGNYLQIVFRPTEWFPAGREALFPLASQVRGVTELVLQCLGRMQRASPLSLGAGGST